MTLAHRVAWELEYGPIPDGMDVLHRCDRPACCRPEHLFLGTHADNMRDRDKKGRTSRVSRNRGETQWQARLTRSQASEIHADARGAAVVAREYGISPATVADIRAGRTWRWLTAQTP